MSSTSLYPIYIIAGGASIHTLASMLPESERPSLCIFRGEAAIRLDADRPERFGELVEQFNAIGKPTVEVCVDYDSDA